MNKKFYSLILILAVFGSLFRPEEHSVALAQGSGSFIRLVRSMPVDETGVPNPAAIVFSRQDNAFLVVRANAPGQPPPADLNIVELDRFVNPSGSTRIAAAIANPMNLAFDNQANRLLVYQASSGKLIEVKLNSKGKLDPANLVRHNALHLRVQDPMGMSMDEHGNLFILDAARPSIVQVALGAGSNLADAPVSAVNLRALGVSDLRGLAVDPATDHFFTLSPGEQKLYELTRSGEVAAVRDLSQFGLVNPQGMAFAPSGDQTDDPRNRSLYLADSGTQFTNETVKTNSSQVSQLDSRAMQDIPDIQSSGKIVELSLMENAGYIPPSFSSQLVHTLNLAAISPPSPDPSGIVYLPASDTFRMVDSEVEETVTFVDSNVWELELPPPGGVINVIDTANISSRAPTVKFVTDEPTGITWNPAGTGHFYFSDDNKDLIYDLRPGVDGQFWTSDDTFPTPFSVRGSGSGDPEDLTYASANNSLYVVDGINAEVYRYSLNGSLLSQFDVQQYGVFDPNGITYNSASQTLFILSSLPNKIIVETTLAGTLLRVIDYSAIDITTGNGLAFGPASDNSGANRFYVVECNIDNDIDPNENDGELFEITAPEIVTIGNLPPIIDAGLDQDITLPTNSVNLNGTASDDGMPNPPGTFTTNWRQLSGPCNVTFGDPGIIDTTAEFPYAGLYLLQLEANDSELLSVDTLTVDVKRQSNTTAFDARIESSTDDAEEEFNGAISITETRLQLGQKAGFAQIVGLRFNWIDVPQGATITNAYIQFTTRDASFDPAFLTIKGQAADNATTFSDVKYNISTRGTTTASVPWNPPEWTTVGEQELKQRTPDVSSVIQEIVDRPGWNSGNSVVLIITGTGNRVARPYDNYPCSAAFLHIEYNTTPVAVDDAYATDKNVTLNVLAPGVLMNDTDMDGDTLSATKVSNPSNGALTLNSDGSFSYIPNTGFIGTDMFTYKANDGTADSNIATVSIEVGLANQAPVAVDDSAVTDEDTAKTVNVLANDSDPDGNPLTITTVTQGNHGTVVNNGTDMTYSPDAQWNGTDTFTYTVSDSGLTDTATVTITVNPVNDAPVATDDGAVTAEETAKTVDVLANDTDVDENPLMITAVTQGTHGTVVNNGTEVTYTPDAQWNGTDSFSYTISDGALTDTAIVKVTISSVNDAPVAVDDSATTVKATAKTIDVLANDTDVDENPLTITAVTQGTHGTVVNNGTDVTYTPNAQWYGTDTFTYTASDGALTDTATVTIKVEIAVYLPIILR